MGTRFFEESKISALWIGYWYSHKGRAKDLSLDNKILNPSLISSDLTRGAVASNKQTYSGNRSKEDIISFIKNNQ